MAHIHEKIDFTVAIFVVQEKKVLLIHHRKLDRWLPLGGHIELEEISNEQGPAGNTTAKGATCCVQPEFAG